jgi:uncharacterized protein (TIGR03643 family)
MVACPACVQDESMKQSLTNTMISTIIAAAWADDISFDKIKLDTDYSESEVIAIMRRSLKPKSFVLWRTRVSGRKSKHEKRNKLLARDIE